MENQSDRSHTLRSTGSLAGACLLAACCYLLLPSSVPAAILPAMVLVEDPGNHDHPLAAYGAVNYTYWIGTYEVSNSEYAAFLSATASEADPYGLYHSSMGGISRAGEAGSYSYTVQAGMGDKPVHYVSVYDGARFANWLTNGQGSGGTESGVYQLGGQATPGANALQRTQSAWLDHGYALASIDEWVKAGYYQPVSEGGDTDGYWRYPTGSNLRPSVEDVHYGATGGGFWSQGVDFTGLFPAPASYYGTYHQGGNVSEWVDTIAGSDLGMRMGSAAGGSEQSLNSDDPRFIEGFAPLALEDAVTGLRIVMLETIPEPSAAAAIAGLICLSSVGLARRR